MSPATSRLLSTIFILIVFVGWTIYESWQCWPSTYTPDPDIISQMSQALSGHYNDWKPTLHSWLLGVLELIHPGNGVGMALLVHIFIIGISVTGISLYYGILDKRYTILVLALPLFFTYKGMSINTVSNDVLAAACYLLFISLILWGQLISQKMVKTSFIAIAYTILAYGMVLRHNAIPAIVVLAAWGAWRLGTRPLRACILATCFILITLMGSHILTYQVLRAEPSYPLKSPLANDLVNLSIVQGKWSTYCIENGADKLPAPHEYSMLMPQVANGGVPINPFLIPANPTERKQVYLDMREAWLKEITTHPLDFLAFKSFFYHQHLLQGRCLPVACRYFRSIYPHVRIHMESESQHLEAWLNRQFIVLSLIPLTSFAALIILPIVCRVKHCKFSSLPQPAQDAFCFIATALLYCATFMPFVVAATEFRYYIIRASLCAVALPLLILTYYIYRRPTNLGQTS